MQIHLRTWSKLRLWSHMVQYRSPWLPCQLSTACGLIRTLLSPSYTHTHTHLQLIILPVQQQWMCVSLWSSNGLEAPGPISAVAPAWPNIMYQKSLTAAPAETWDCLVPAASQSNTAPSLEEKQHWQLVAVLQTCHTAVEASEGMAHLSEPKTFRFSHKSDLTWW